MIHFPKFEPHDFFKVALGSKKSWKRFLTVKDNHGFIDPIFFEQSDNHSRRKYNFEIGMVEVLGAILTSKKAIVLFGSVMTNP